MGIVARASRVAGRAVGLTAFSRASKRYPIIGLAIVVWRWWRRREARTERRVISLKPGETVTVSDRASSARGF